MVSGMVLVKLSGDEEHTVLCHLLDNPTLWRVRGYERIDLASALWTERYRSINVSGIEDMIRRAGVDLRNKQPAPEEGKKNEVSLILPISSFPKTLRIDLDIKVNESSVYLLSRRNYAHNYAKYLHKCASNITTIHGTRLSDRLDGRLIALIECIIRYSPRKWTDKIESVRLPAYRRHKIENKVNKTLRGYLRDHPDWNGETIDDPTFGQWIANWSLIRGLVIAHGHPSWRSSCAENPLLAVPASGLTVGNVAGVLNNLYRFLLEANEVWKDQPAARHLLEAYANSGRYWVGLARCVVPIDKPFSINVSEKRVLYFTRNIPPNETSTSRIQGKYLTSLKKKMTALTGWPLSAGQLVIFADAESNHLTVRVPDNGVELRDVKRRRMRRGWDVRYYSSKTVNQAPGEAGQGQAANQGQAPGEAGQGQAADESDSGIYPEEIESDRELFTCYSSRLGRPRALWFRFPLRQTNSIRLTLWTIFLALIAAFAALAIVGWYVGLDGGDGVVTGKDIAILLIPISLAASLLLTRGNTTLGMRVNRLWHSMTALLLVFLWVGAVAFFVVSAFTQNPSCTEVKSPRPVSGATAARGVSCR